MKTEIVSGLDQPTGPPAGIRVIDLTINVLEFSHLISLPTSHSSRMPI